MPLTASASFELIIQNCFLLSFVRVVDLHMHSSLCLHCIDRTWSIVCPLLSLSITSLLCLDPAPGQTMRAVALHDNKQQPKQERVPEQTMLCVQITACWRVTDSKQLLYPFYVGRKCTFTMFNFPPSWQQAEHISYFLANVRQVKTKTLVAMHFFFLIT